MGKQFLSGPSGNKSSSLQAHASRSWPSHTQTAQICCSTCSPSQHLLRRACFRQVCLAHPLLPLPRASFQLRFPEFCLGGGWWLVSRGSGRDGWDNRALFAAFLLPLCRCRGLPVDRPTVRPGRANRQAPLTYLHVLSSDSRLSPRSGGFAPGAFLALCAWRILSLRAQQQQQPSQLAEHECNFDSHGLSTDPALMTSAGLCTHPFRRSSAPAGG